MKAILVIDMPDNLKNHLDKVKVDVIGTLNRQELFHRLNQPLKPMPQKKSIDYDIDHIEDEFFAYGWNDCIDEILGGENE